MITTDGWVILPIGTAILVFISDSGTTIGMTGIHPGGTGIHPGMPTILIGATAGATGLIGDTTTGTTAIMDTLTNLKELSTGLTGPSGLTEAVTTTPAAALHRPTKQLGLPEAI